MVEIKFCGVMRPEDAKEGVSLGARYIGVILAESPRMLSDADAAAVFRSLPATVSRVGVFGLASAPEDIATRATQLGLDVIQLHGDPDAATVVAVRQLWPGRVWAARRVEGAALPQDTPDLFDAADAVVLDARVPGKLGGTGVALPWSELHAQVAPLRGRRARLVLAGGLRPENVARAVETMQPDIVDVSSGVESSVGVKDHIRMRAFRDAVMVQAS